MSWAINRTAGVGLDGNYEAYLNEGLGVALMKNQDKARMDAIANPATFITNRYTAIENLNKADGAVGQYFKKRLDDYVATGFPYDHAVKLATENAKLMLEQEVKIMELKTPGAFQAAFGQKQLENNIKIAETKMVAPELLKSRSRSGKRRK